MNSRSFFCRYSICVCRSQGYVCVCVRDLGLCVCVSVRLFKELIQTDIKASIKFRGGNTFFSNLTKTTQCSIGRNYKSNCCNNMSNFTRKPSTVSCPRGGSFGSKLNIRNPKRCFCLQKSRSKKTAWRCRYIYKVTRVRFLTWQDNHQFFGFLFRMSLQVTQVCVCVPRPAIYVLRV